MTETDILIIEDNKEICDILTGFLRREGYTVSVANSGEKALALFEKYGAKLLLLDLMLPGMDGFSVCSEIRRIANTPIIFISARSDRESKLNSLVLGADDFIEKPIDIDILLAKINGIFKRRIAGDVIKDGDIEVNRDTLKLTANGKQYDLTVKEMELLFLLMDNKGVTLKKEYLFNTVWGFDSDSELQTLTVHIKWLREKIEPDSKNPIHIKTVWGVGYRYE
ncbi:MAG: response regulator transcription factor [Clostridia bacterium]|nr:response regulator transcription factor [Clostridia bacterium]